MNMVRNWAIKLVLLAALVLILWASTPFVTGFLLNTSTLAEKGQFGDLFGSINALFSGLAFAGIAVSLWLQWEEIHKQNDEITRSLALQQQTVDALTKAMYARSFDKVYDILDAEEVISARHTIYALEDSKVPFDTWKHLPDWTEKKKQIDTFLRAHNIAGIIVKNGYLPLEHIVPDWEPHFRRSWGILEPYVREQRRCRGSDNHWPNYESLAIQAELCARAAQQPAAGDALERPSCLQPPSAARA